MIVSKRQLFAKEAAASNSNAQRHHFDCGDRKLWMGLLILFAVADAGAAPISFWAGEGDANDSGGSNHGSLNTTSFAPGVSGQAFQFSGTGPGVVVNDDPTLRLTELTVSFWAKKTDLNSVDVVLQKGGDWTQNQTDYGVTVNSAANQFGFYFFYAGGYRGTVGFADLEWHHYVATAKNGEINPRLWIDGVEKAVTLVNNSTPMVLNSSSTSALEIGWQSGITYYSSLTLDSLSIYGSVLSDAQVKALFETGSSSHVPDSGSTLALFGFSIFALLPLLDGARSRCYTSHGASLV